MCQLAVKQECTLLIWSIPQVVYFPWHVKRCKSTDACRGDQTRRLRTSSAHVLCARPLRMSSSGTPSRSTREAALCRELHLGILRQPIMKFPLRRSNIMTNAPRTANPSDCLQTEEQFPRYKTNAPLAPPTLSTSKKLTYINHFYLIFVRSFYFLRAVYIELRFCWVNIIGHVHASFRLARRPEVEQK